MAEIIEPELAKKAIKSVQISRRDVPLTLHVDMINVMEIFQ